MYSASCRIGSAGGRIGGSGLIVRYDGDGCRVLVVWRRADGHHAGGGRSALCQGVLETKPVCRIGAVQRDGRFEAVSIGTASLFGLASLLGLFDGLVVEADDVGDDDAHGGAPEFAFTGLVGGGPARTARAAEEVQVIAGTECDLVAEQLRCGLTQLFELQGVLVGPDAVVEFLQRGGDGSVGGCTEVFTQQAIPPRGGEVGGTGGAVAAVTLVLVAQVVEAAHGHIALVERPEDVVVDADGRVALGAALGGGEAVADLNAIGVDTAAVVDEVVALVARHVDDLFGFVVVIDVTAGVDDALDRGIAAILTIADDVTAHGSRVGGGFTGNAGSCQRRE